MGVLCNKTERLGRGIDKGEMPQEMFGCENESDGRRRGVSLSVYDMDKETGS